MKVKCSGIFSELSQICLVKILSLFSLSQFVVSSCHSSQTDDDDDDGEIRSLCGALAVVRLLVYTKIILDY